jgi:capsular polysaccharide biosynthesis protein
MVDDIYKYTKDFAIQQKTLSKKVYLSRKSVIPKDAESILKNTDAKNLSFIHDERIDGEEILENFFKENGFAIVYPEDFSSFREQIGFMQEVDVLVSLTGASLTNCIFMKPGKTVIELSTTLVLGGEESLHTHFYDIAYAKNHNFISIRHDRVAQNVINKLTNSGILG